MDKIPDYGLTLFNQGARDDATFDFPNFYLDHIAAVAPCAFSTCVEVPLEGTMHALSLDFDVDKLEEILVLCPPATTQLVLDWVKGLCGAATLDLPEPVCFGVSAKLGQPETCAAEQYVPLVAQRVYAAPGE